MISSSKTGQIDEDFRIIVAFDYYDGPESGLAIDSTGKTVRFASVGDSDSRFQRGFEMAAIAIEGDWWQSIRVLMLEKEFKESQRIIVPLASPTLARLQDSVMKATANRLFVAVGSPNLERLSITEVDDTQISALRELGCSPAGFRMAERIVGRVG